MAQEMDRLLRKLMVKFVTLTHIRGQPDLRHVDYDNFDNQHDDDTIAIGLQTRTLLAEMEDDLDPHTITVFFK